MAQVKEQVEAPERGPVAAQEPGLAVVLAKARAEEPGQVQAMGPEG